MSGLDLALILLAVLGAFFGMKIGAVSAFFNVLGGFVGGWAATRFYLPVTALIQLEPTTSYLLVFLLAAGFFVLLGVIVSHALEFFFLGLVDKLFGALLGMGLSLMFVTALFLPMLLEQNSSTRQMFRRSSFAPYLVRTMQKYLDLAPPDVWDKLEPAIQSEAVLKARQALESGIRTAREKSASR
jgi:uncharacterized membrane protein required for colicin V production